MNTKFGWEQEEAREREREVSLPGLSHVLGLVQRWRRGRVLPEA